MYVQVTSGLNQVSEACSLLVYFTDLIGIVECVPAHCQKCKVIFCHRPYGSKTFAVAGW